MGLSAVGTLNRNRRLLPAQMTDVKDRTQGSSQICFRNDVMLSSFCPKPGKVVLVASTQHKLPQVDQKTGKPEVILFYNNTKFGVDVCDKIIANFMCGAPVRRWPMKILFFVVSVACLNAHHMFTTTFPDSNAANTKHGGRMRFVRAVGMQLLAGQAELRASIYTSDQGGHQPAGGAGLISSPRSTAAVRARTVRNSFTSWQMRALHDGESPRRIQEETDKYCSCSKSGRSACTKHKVAARICALCQ